MILVLECPVCHGGIVALSGDQSTVVAWHEKGTECEAMETIETEEEPCQEAA